MSFIGAILCVLAICAGQILFKFAAINWKEAASILEVNVALPVIVAFALYAISAFGWLAILRNAQLAQVYPLISLSFVIVPMSSVWFFGERVSLANMVGLTLIVAGAVLATRPS